MKRSRDRFFELAHEAGFTQDHVIDMMWHRDRDTQEDFTDEVLLSLFRISLRMAEHEAFLWKVRMN